MGDITEASSIEIFAATFILAALLVLPIFFGYKLLRFLTSTIRTQIKQSSVHYSYYSPFSKSIRIHIAPDDMRKLNAIAKKNKRSPKSEIEYMVSTEIENYEIVHGKIYDGL